MTPVNIETMKPLAPLTTLRVGGPALFFCEVRSEQEIEEVVQWTSTRKLPLFVLGGGSNLLVADAGFNGMVLHVALKGISVREAATPTFQWQYQVAAGEDWDCFVERTLSDVCAGIECLAGIPGTVGGTPVQNVGAYGQEVSTTIVRIRAFDVNEQNFVEFSAAECEFAYRRSRFNTHDRGRFIVTRVDYGLTRGGAPSLQYADLQRAFNTRPNPALKEVGEAVRRIRQSKGMLLVDDDPDCQSAGSFFKNPIVKTEHAAAIASRCSARPPQYPAGPGNEGSVKLSAAWLIENAGFTRGYALHRAAISTKHNLALVNLGGAKAAEILDLANRIKVAVMDRFEIELQIEPVLLGF